MQTKIFQSLFICVVLLLTNIGTAAGQEQTQQDQQQEKPKDKAATSPRGAQSLVEDAFHSARHRVGFSIGAFEVYQNNLYQTSQNLQTASSTAMTLRIFANLGGRNSSFSPRFRCRLPEDLWPRKGSSFSISKQMPAITSSYPGTRH